MASPWDTGCNCLSCQNQRTVRQPVYVPFELDTEPVYTHVLVDYEDGETYPELHTAESLIEAIKLRKDSDERFQVFELGESILDCPPA